MVARRLLLRRHRAVQHQQVQRRREQSRGAVRWQPDGIGEVGQAPYRSLLGSPLQQVAEGWLRVDQRQRGRRQRPTGALEGAEGLAEIEGCPDACRGSARPSGSAGPYRDHQTLAPAQVQQALGVVGVVMGLEDAIEAMGREALAEIDQAAVDQPTLAGALQQRYRDGDAGRRRRGRCDRPGNRNRRPAPGGRRRCRAGSGACAVAAETSQEGA